MTRPGLFPSHGGRIVDLGLIALISLPTLFIGLGDLPVVLWDESRLANNAVEMSRNGWSLVTTYAGQADLWNTKPPLLIWLMALSFDLFGVSEWSLRLPSALAALATALLVYHFCRTVTNSRRAGVGGALILLTSYGYVAPHVARTGDYDALLVLFTTALVVCCHAIVERLRRRDDLPLPLLACTALALTGAILTKGVAGVLIVPGIAAAALLRGVAVPALTSARLWAALGLSLAVAAAYYLTREATDPGYLAAVSANELGSRFSTPVEGHAGSPFFYVVGLLAPWGRAPTDFYLASAFPWSWIAVALLFVPVGATPGAIASRYVAVVLTVFLLIISAAQTKLSWYVAPAFPLLACFTAIKAHALLSGSRGPGVTVGMRAAGGAAAVLALTVVLLATRIAARHDDDVVRAHTHSDLTAAAFLRELADQPPPVRALLIMKARAAARSPAVPGPEQYAPQERFYAAILRSRGIDARVVTLDHPLRHDDAWAWCGPDPDRSDGASHRIIAARGPCRAGIVARTAS